MKTTSRILSMLLVLAMALAIVPVGFVTEVEAATSVLPTVTGSVRAINDIDTFVNGIPANTTDIVYLSDQQGANTTNYKVNKPFDAGTGTEAHNVIFTEPSLSGRNAKLINGKNAVASTTVTINGVSVTCKNSEIRLGGYATKYDKGLGCNAATSTATATSNTYETNGAEYFYAVVGVTGTYGTKSSDGTPEGTTYKTTFTLSGKKAGETTYTELASATVYWWLTAEFLVDISEYESVQLSQKANHTSGGRYGAWGNASFLWVEDAADMVNHVGEPISGVAGIPAFSTGVQYLSDMTPVAAKSNRWANSAYAADEVTHRNDSPFYISSITQYVFTNGVLTGAKGAGLVPEGATTQDLYLGWNHTLYEKGVSVFAGLSAAKAASLGVAEGTDLPNWLVYEVPENAAHFYAVAGNNGTNTAKTAYPVRFEVYGTKSDSVDGAEWVRLGASTVAGYNTAEFCLDISGYNFIKLSHQNVGSGAQGNLECAWGNASFLKSYQTTARFESALSLLTKWNNAAFAGITGAQVTFQGEVVNSEFTNGSDYIVEYPGVAGKEMTEKVTVSLLNGEKTVTTVTASIRDHALEYLANGGNAYYKTAVYHMLQFGAAAQNYFNYNTGAMANADLEQYAGNAMTGEVSKEGVVARSEKDANGYFYGTNLRLEDRINLMFYFENLPAGATAKITVNGKTVEKAVKDMGNGISMVEMDELAVADYKAAVVCTIYDGETEIVSVQDSVAGYAFRAIEKNDKRAAVCAELLKYAESVKVYLENK